MSNRNGIPLESGPAAIRVEIWVSVPQRFTYDVPQSLLDGIDFFQGQDWDSWLEDYSPNVASARILRFEPANEDYDEEGSQRVVYTMDLFSEWEMDPEEFEERMSYDWGEGYWLPEPVPWFIDKRSARCICASCELIPPIHPPNIPMLGSASKALISVGDNGSLSGWQVVGSGIADTREGTRLIRKSLGPVLEWIETADDELWFAAVIDPIIAGTSGLGHEYPFYIGVLPDIQPTMKVAERRFRELGVEAEDLAAHYRREALSGLLCKVAELNPVIGAPREHCYPEEVVLWPLVNFGSAWRLEFQRDALDGIQRFLDRSTSGVETISLRQQRTQPFEFEMDSATVARLLERNEEGSRFATKLQGSLQPMKAQEVAPADVGCPEVPGLQLWKLVPATESDPHSSVIDLNA
ncbi:MAG: hypothetical protein WCH97_02745 [Actinomycetes bacterium]